MRFVLSFPVILLMILVCTTLVVGQSANPTLYGETCQGPVYKASEVSVKAKILFRPDVLFTEEARTHDVHGRVVVEAVLCRTGRVTDIKVVEGLPYGMTEAVVNTIWRYRFTAAEMGWHTVSQFIRMEYGFNEEDGPQLSQAEAAGREVVRIEIVGNRDIGENEIITWIKTALGEPLDVEQVQQDFRAIMGKGYFDKSSSRVSIEEVKRGGVAVVFELYELPRISDVKFDGLEDVSGLEVLDAFKRANLDIMRGAVFDPVIVRSSINVLKQLLLAHGNEGAKVEILTEQVEFRHLVLTYVIKRK